MNDLLKNIFSGLSKLAAVAEETTLLALISVRAPLKWLKLKKKEAKRCWKLMERSRSDLMPNLDAGLGHQSSD